MGMDKPLSPLPGLVFVSQLYLWASWGLLAP